MRRLVFRVPVAAALLGICLLPGEAFADFQFKKGSFTKSTAAVSQSITGLSFQPKAVMFFWTRQTTAETFNPEIQTGYGFATGPANERSIALASQDGIDPGNVGRGQWQSSSIVLFSDATPTVAAQAELTSLDPDGFTLNWTLNEARADIIHFVALGGSDITNAKVDSFIKATGTGNLGVTGVGFKPDFVMLLSAHQTALDATLENGQLGLGFASSPTERATVAVQLEELTFLPPPRNTWVRQRTDRVLVEMGDDGAPTTEFDFVSFDPDGFTVNRIVNVNDGRPVHYLALQGGKYKVGSFNKSVAVGDQPVTVGLSPAGVLLASKNLVTSAAVEPQGRISFGAGDGTTEGATWWHDTDTQISDANERTSTSKIAVHATSTATLNAEADLKSLDTNGFTLTWTTNNAVAHEILYVAFGKKDANYRSIGTRPNYGTAEPVEGAGTTVEATLGSRLVTGALTTWTTSNRGRGDAITISGVNYTVFRVISETQLELTTPFGGTTGPGQSYTIARQFTTLAAWEDCIDGPPVAVAPCTYFPPASNSLVTDNRSEVGIAYKDSVLAGGLSIDGNIGNNTDAAHTITLTADLGNRHYGVAGAGVIVDLLFGAPGIHVLDDYVTLEWLEIRDNLVFGTGTGGIHIGTPNVNHKLVVQNNLIHNLPGGAALNFLDAHDTDVFNNIIYEADVGIDLNGFSSNARIFNNTIYGCNGVGPPSGISDSNTTNVTMRNNIVHSNVGGDIGGTARNAASSNNLTSDTSGTTNSPAGGGINSVPLSAPPVPGPAGVNFVDTTAPSENLHILGSSRAVNNGAELSAVFPRDIDNVIRLTLWEIGADDTSQTTAVTLQSFTAMPVNGAVDLSWTTASELNNLGFHLYRSESSELPYTRITSSLIPGLGSSPTGQTYSYVDSGLVNGRTYFYKLEDVETTGRTELHGPVSATPSAASPGGGGAPPSGSGSSRVAYGDPSSVVLREVERSSRHVVLELRTGGFYASQPEDGRVRLSIPGFESASRAGEPELPMRRAFVEAVAGRKVRLASILASDLLHFPALRPSSEGVPEIEVSADGSILPSRHAVQEGPAFRGLFPAVSARLQGSRFQGERKKAEVLLFPLRWDGNGLELSRRLLVRVEFAGTEGSETSRGGSSGRQRVQRASHARSGVLAQLIAKGRGLYRVDYEDVFSAPSGGTRQRRGTSVSSLRLSRQGESVAFHVEPQGAVFGPGSSLYFLSEGSSLNLYGDAVYELETNTRGLLMPVERLASAPGIVFEHFPILEKEENKYYQAGLLDAPDLWLWDIVISPATKSYPFTVEHLSASSSSGRLSVSLQGASDFEGVVDHHVRVKVNGIAVGETSWDGKLPQSLDVEVPPGVLHEGQNSLDIEDVGDTGAAYSMVFLNRFSLSYPQGLVAVQGKLEGHFETSGQAEVQGLSSTSVLIDTTATPRWLIGASAIPSGLSFPVQAGKSYLATSTFVRPEVRLVPPSTLKSDTNHADYLLLGPSAFLPAAQPLLDYRQSQGLVTKAVSLEEVYEQFGHGEVSPKAIKEFLEYAYHFWASPSPRYVLLLGDASYDTKDYLKTGVKNWLPGFPVKTSYLWTVSDPAYAAVNGDDLLPDLAIGRLPASSVAEAERLIEKILLFENGGGDFLGRAVLVADNADLAGNFEQDADEIAATLLASRSPQKIYYSQLGGSTRASITEAFDVGASLMSYVGHGGTVVWASENIFNYQDVQTLAPQPQQPLLLTLNCLNGFFHFPPMNSLSEALLKAEGKGVIGAFSPSGLSVNHPAHLFHKALLQEILSGRHERLGDAILAAQETYATSGGFPELLSIYHLFGDPALEIQ